MKGLDYYIMGVNDQNAPFNQTDWTEEFYPILDECDWITDEMLDDKNTREALGEIICSELTKFMVPQKYYPTKELYRLKLLRAKEIADSSKIIYLKAIEIGK